MKFLRRDLEQSSRMSMSHERATLRVAERGSDWTSDLPGPTYPAYSTETLLHKRLWLVAAPQFRVDLLRPNSALA